MTGESQQVPAKAPDPTVMTTEQLDRTVKGERGYVDAQLDVLRQRLDGIDKATEVLNQTVNRTPTVIDREIDHVREVNATKLLGVEQQFTERDTRAERESMLNKVAVDAAFAAQKEAAAKSDEANQKAIDKAEKATADTLNKLSELFRSSTDAIHLTIVDLKSRMDRIEANRLGATTERTEHRNVGSDNRAIIASAIGIVLFLLAVAGFVIAQVSTKG